MNITLSGKNAFVCGSTQGIGKACALELAAMGASVTLLARDEAALAAVLKDLAATQGQRHDFIVADFNEPEALLQKVKAYLGQTGKSIQVLVNNTGGPPSGPITEATPDDFRLAFNRHVLCNQLLVQALLPGMKQSGYGRIINIISTSVKIPIDNLGVSNTIRAAVANWAKTLANEVGQFGITVNNVLPGSTETQRQQQLFEKRATRLKKPLAEVIEAARVEIPLGRFAQPEEIAWAVAFLASPAGAYVHGINLPVDGGRLGSL
jgi:3-oxoacyl-[acyl-carrier protein] reductase